MGEVVNLSSDFTTNNLSVSQKVGIILESAVANSRFLGNRKRREQERAERERSALFDALKAALLTNINVHLIQNQTLAKMNQEAEVVQFAIDRRHLAVLEDVLQSSEFNMYEFELVNLDSDIVNSFGEAVPVIASFRQREVAW
jgi:hypothetical protein